MDKEEFIKAITKLPKTELSNSLSSMHGINIDDLISAIERFNKIPTYDELLKENQKYKEVFDKISKIIYEIKELTETTGGYPSNYIDNLLDILKEVK